MAKKIDVIKESTETRETAEILAGLCVDWKTECNHNCKECVDMIEKFLEEDSE